MRTPGALFWMAVVVAWLGTSPIEAGCRDMDIGRGLTPLAYAAQPDAIIEYFGHSFFQVTTARGTKIVMDPLAPGRYPTPSVAPDAITVGREHPNHNYVQLAQGNPIILRGLTNHGAEWNRVSTRVSEVSIYSVPIYQKGVLGNDKGAAFVFDLGPLCLVHLGDLSHPLTPEQLHQIGSVDVALMPIGGVYTMGPETAREVLQQLNPKIAIPMHYRDNLVLLQAFVDGLPTRHLGTETLILSKASLPATTEIIVLRPRGARD
jgi:L-ascorbate metabolism protein UlaG (beta-lactamase superfamily)